LAVVAGVASELVAVYPAETTAGEAMGPAAKLVVGKFPAGVVADCEPIGL
jgi:hypothetical protein